MPADPPPASARDPLNPPPSPLRRSVGTSASVNAVRPHEAVLAIALCAGAQLSSARHQLRGWALGLGVDPDRAYDISAGTYEALANAIEHAYPDQHGPVTLTAHHHTGSGAAGGGGEEIMVVVSDEGSWRTPPSDTRWRGRGLMLITALGGQLEIRAGEHGTTATIRWALP